MAWWVNKANELELVNSYKVVAKALWTVPKGTIPNYLALCQHKYTILVRFQNYGSFIV